MMTVLKVLSALLVFAVLGATFWLVDALQEEAAVPELAPAREGEGQGPTVEPGDLAFERARELLATGDFEEAREKLEFIVGVYPDSESAEEARRILGELNLDDLLSIDSMEGKELYKVQRGDAFLSVANRFDTTIDCLMHLNGLQRLDQLFPGDELVLLRLNLNMKVDVERKRLTLFRAGRPLKAYPLLEARVKAGSRGTVHSTIKAKGGFIDGRNVKITADEWRESAKVITLATAGLQIREIPEANDDDPVNGFFLKKADVEELSMLLRVGNEVEVRFTSQ